jgi:hypothetical protein
MRPVYGARVTRCLAKPSPGWHDNVNRGMMVMIQGCRRRVDMTWTNGVHLSMVTCKSPL